VASEPDAGALLTAAAAGDRRATGRVLSAIEAGGPTGRELERATFAPSGPAWVVGLTGPPGAGKSTIGGILAARLRAAGERVALVAVDPTSACSGGALLADRARLSLAPSEGDDGVLVRSMASRHALDGLAPASRSVVRALEWLGWGVVVVETVGAGQVGTGVAAACDTTVLVLTPESGDDLQAAKAGPLEVADVVVVNKADRLGAAAAVATVTGEVGAAGGREGAPEVVATAALAGEGIDELVAALGRHRRRLAEPAGDGGTVKEHRRRRALEAELEARLGAELTRVGARARAGPGFAEAVAGLVAGTWDPARACELVLGPVLAAGLRAPGDRPGEGRRGRDGRR